MHCGTESEHQVLNDSHIFVSFTGILLLFGTKFQYSCERRQDEEGKQSDQAAIRELVLTFCPTMHSVQQRKLKLLMLVLVATPMTVIFVFASSAYIRVAWFPISATTRPPSVDLASINSRLQQLQNFQQAISFPKKDSLQKELEACFSARAPNSSHSDPRICVVS